MLLLFLLGFCAVLIGPSLQYGNVLGNGAPCGGWELAKCDVNLTCVNIEGSGPSDEYSEPTGICKPGPAPGCVPCSSRVCPRRRRDCGRRSHIMVDPCGCCPQCAREKGEVCGGRHWEKGYCDWNLACSLIHGIGLALAPTTGVCKVLPGRKHYYKSDPVCPWVFGCGRRAGTCQCWNTQTCFHAYSYDDVKDCEVELERWMYAGPEEGEEEEYKCTTTGCEIRGDRCECRQISCSSPRLPNKDECGDLLEKELCKNTTCQDVPTLSCPADSFLVKPYTPPGQCCPLLDVNCSCDLEKCPVEPPACPSGELSQLIKKGDGHPGSCCDQYKCMRDRQ